MLSRSSKWDFWQTALAIHDSAIPRVAVQTALFGAFALVVYVANELTPAHHLGISVAPYEIGGALLGTMVVLRMNAGYDRWWEARKIWGAIINQSRNFGIKAIANSPDSAQWRDRIVRLAAVFPHVIRHRLRGERDMPRVAHLLGDEECRRIANAEHMPCYISMLISQMLRDGRERLKLDSFVFLQLDRELSQMMDHVGGCERILKTPLTRVYAIEIHRLILVFLITLPFVLLDQVTLHWTVPFATMLTAYPLLAINQIGIDLQNPFDVNRLGHLDLDGYCETVEQNLMALLTNDGFSPSHGQDPAKTLAIPIL